MIKLSDYLVKFFENQNIEKVFMLVGGGCMHLVNSFGQSKINYICTHHEQGAAISAEAYTKVTNKKSIVLVTSGPGSTNTITGLVGCYQDSIPVIFISGQTKVSQTVANSGVKNLRQFGSQEVDIISIVKSITKYAVEVQNPNDIRYHLERAIFETTNGRPGPVWLSIPLDIQGALIEENNLKPFINEISIKDEATIDEIDFLINAIKFAKRPVIIAGHGIKLANANSLLKNFCEKYKIPVVTPIMGVDNLEYNHLCNIGRIGTKGTRAGNFAMQNSDLIISLGSRLSVASVGHEYNLFAREAKVVVVDIDENEHLKKTIKIDKIINCNVKNILNKLLLRNDLNIDFNDWLNKCNEWKERYPVILEQYNDDSNGINFYKFIDILNENMLESMPVVVDGGGSCFYIVPQSIKLKKNQHYITSGGVATMGFALPAAIGASIAKPNNTVIAITGEGSLMQNLQELEVLKYHNLKVKLFVINNNGYYLIRKTQEKYFDNLVGESSSTGISFPNLEKITKAFDLKFYKLENIKSADLKLKDILLEDGPAVIEVICDKDMEIMPLNTAELKEDGTIVSKPLEDMYPFLDRDTFKKEMIIDIIE